jgi:ParB family transcriptional regulator, chromosome partitioning protein
MAGLGRGLDSLLSASSKIKKERETETKTQEEIAVVNNETTTSVGENVVASLPIEKLRASIYQPRKSFDEESLQELADSIKEHGLLEPLIVKKTDDLYEIICGERRYRACKLAQLDTVPCLVRDDLDSKGYAIALIENIQREDLNPLEMAEAFKQMLDECNLNQDELAKTLGKSRSSVANILRLNNLQSNVKQMVAANQIDLGHAKVLLSIEEPDLQLKTALYVIKNNLTVRQTEELVKNIKVNGIDDEEKKTKKPSFDNEFFSNWENEISSKLSGVKVKFKATNEDKGKLTLTYSSQEQLKSLLSLLEVEE